MEELNKFLNKKFTFSLKPLALLSIAVVWAYFFQSVIFPLPMWVFHLLVFAYLGGAYFIYSNIRQEIIISGKNFLVFFSILGINLFFHLNNLFSSIGGDEIYHVGKSNIILSKIREGVLANGIITKNDFDSSIWNLFNLGHFPVSDIWRVVSFLILILLIPLSLFLIEKAKKRPKLVFSLIIIATYFIGAYLALGPEQHPPLRTLPIFVSKLVFGFNNFAFKFPGVMLTSIISFTSYLFLNLESQEKNPFLNYLFSLSISFIPVVFYAADLVEPSIYGFGAYALTMLLVLRFYSSKNYNLLILAGITVALGTILRQPTCILWLLVGGTFLTCDYRFNIKKALPVFFPGLIALPYFYTVKSIGHVAMNNSPIVDLLKRSITDGVGVMTILNTSTIPWTLLTILLFALVIRKIKVFELSLYLLFIPAYVIYFTIWVYLWGIGRYQTEYVAPFIFISIFFGAKYLAKNHKKYISFILLFLILFSVELNAKLSLDINYKEWPKARITTALRFPYKDALNYLKKQEALGNFVFLGGAPWYNESIIWLSNANFSEGQAWHHKQYRFNEFIKKERTNKALKKFMKKRGVKTIVSHTGTKIERQHRTKLVNQLTRQLEKNNKCDGKHICRERSFYNKKGGVLNLFTVN